MAKVDPPGARTNYAHPGCYLSPVDDNCSEHLNREHYLSESILEILDFEGGSRGVWVEGFPWLDAPKPLPPNAIASKILCERHNEGLSPLDTCALRFFQCLMAMPEQLRTPKGKRDQIYMFSGPDLERWTIKLLAGLLVSGNAMLDGNKIVSTVPPWWLEVLMGRKTLPPGAGFGSMDFVGRAPEKLRTHVAFGPVFYNDGSGDQPAGGTIFLNALSFGLVMMNIPNKAGTWAEHFIAHANVIKMAGPRSSVTVLLSGPGWDQGSGVELAWTPDPAGI